MINKGGNTKTEKSLTPKKEVKKESKPVIWSIRNVEIDTRRVIEKASDRLGKTLGEYLNQDVRAFAQSQITQTQLPASPKDIQNQIEYLTKMVEEIAIRIPEQEKKSMWQRLLNKSVKS